MITITNLVYKSCRRFSVFTTDYSQQSIPFIYLVVLQCIACLFDSWYRSNSMFYQGLFGGFRIKACCIYIVHVTVCFCHLIGPCNLCENIITLYNQFAYGRGRGNMIRFRIYFLRSKIMKVNIEFDVFIEQTLNMNNVRSPHNK